jgi:hypothetical protein
VLALLLAPTIKTIDPEGAPAATPWWLYAAIVGVLLIAGGVILVLAVRKSQQGEEVPCKSCGRILMPDWQVCMFCKTPRVVRAASLEFISGPLAGRSVPLDGDVTTIGSATNSTVTLTDSGVSRKHAGIRKAGPASYELADLGSTNGVYVNGEKVPKKMLQLGDVIRIGTTEIVFKC